MVFDMLLFHQTKGFVFGSCRDFPGKRCWKRCKPVTSSDKALTAMAMHKDLAEIKAICMAYLGGEWALTTLFQVLQIEAMHGKQHGAALSPVLNSAGTEKQ